MGIVRITTLLLVAVTLLLAPGCKKKSEPTAPPSPGTAGSGIGTLTEKAVATAEAVALDISKSLDQVKTEAQKMDASQLRAMAEKCIAAIKDKDSQISALMEKQKAIPMDKLATDAQKLIDEIKTLQSSADKIKEQFKVYYDTLVAKGGDTSGLELP